MRATLKTAAALVLCTAAAAIVARVAAGYPRAAEIVPIGFTAVLIAASFLFGAAGALVAACCAAMIFAYALFPPLHSFQVSSDGARASLGTMVMVTTIVAYFLSSPSDRRRPYRR